MHSMQIHYIETLPSTQTKIIEFITDSLHCPIALFTFNQTQGKGQRNHSWSCPPNSGIAVSLAIPFSKNQNLDWVALNKKASYAVVSFLRNLSEHPIQLKWPNDLIYNDLKLGGILMQVVQKESFCFLILGIGVNVKPLNHLPQSTALHEICPALISLTLESITHKLIAHVYQEFHELIAVSRDLDYENMLWRLNQKVLAQMKNEHPKEERYFLKEVLLVGVDSHGRALLKTDEEVQAFHHGHARLQLPTKNT
jgi:BirA family transcriptional regulator, biotin operon repressor / biotin---[acetyl-CoA-carboxylase] ligase